MSEFKQTTEMLLSLVQPGFGGSPNPLLVEKVKSLARQATMLKSGSYCRGKASSLVNWVEIACSHKRFAPWGLRTVEQFAFEAAYVLDGLATMSDISLPDRIGD